MSTEVSSTYLTELLERLNTMSKKELVDFCYIRMSKKNECSKRIYNENRETINAKRREQYRAKVAKNKETQDCEIVT